ncbi:HP0495 family protein [Legionella impletisoli]|uniref:UPF0250 protein GCM10007966_01110 n=1 Tax=Legionella impletisoli TaxID=343510 RepID=A0A917JM36_9GAMM|nr:DUF493 domain-containing protein [Legionella impletisoli]GGI76001.1 UPF0250 protein [Legionella impletisoli]
MTDQNKMIEFPCNFPIKVFGKNETSFIVDIKNIAMKHDSELTEKAFQTEISAQGTYVSITITVRAKDQPSLDALYLELSSHPDVKMVL